MGSTQSDSSESEGEQESLHATMQQQADGAAAQHVGRPRNAENAKDAQSGGSSGGPGRRAASLVGYCWGKHGSLQHHAHGAQGTPEEFMPSLHHSPSILLPPIPVGSAC